MMIIITSCCTNCVVDSLQYWLQPLQSKQTSKVSRSNRRKVFDFYERNVIDDAIQRITCRRNAYFEIHIRLFIQTTTDDDADDSELCTETSCLVEQSLKKRRQCHHLRFAKL